MSRLREPIRVLFVVPNLDVGGAERHVATLLPVLDPTRFRPAVCCIKNEGTFFAALKDAGIPAVALGAGTREAPLALVRLVRLCRRLGTDVVVSRGFNAESLGRLAALIARVPVSVVWKHHCTEHGSGRPLQSIVDSLLDPLTDRYFAVARAQVPYLVDELGLPRYKIRVVHNGLDPDAFAAGAGPAADLASRLGEGPVVTIVARFRPEKDHETFLRAGREVLRQMPEARLLLVGDGAGLADAERLADTLGLGERAIFAGSREDVAAVLRLTTGSVISSRSIECFPYSVLEAMAMGVPTVGTTVGGLPEMIADGVSGRLVPSRDPVALARAILEVLRSPDAGRAMGEAARRRLEEEFTLERAARATEGLLEQALAAKR